MNTLFVDLGSLRSRSILNARGDLSARGVGRIMTIVLLAVLGCVAALGSASAASRVALVMVAQDYEKFAKSGVGTKRGVDIADALRARGFEVMINTAPNNASARASLRDFTTAATGAEMALAIVIGHGVSASGQSFFLPTNAEIGRSTDLLSRGISISNLAQIVGRARAGGVIFLMTTPTFSAPIAGLDPRPQPGGEANNVVTVFSTSAKVPASRVEAISIEAADAVVDVAQKRGRTLRDLIAAASKGDLGLVVGTAPALPLDAPATPVTRPAAPAAVASPGVSSSPESKPASEGGRQAVSDQESREAAARSSVNKSDMEKARAETEQAQAEVLRAKSDARKAKADAEKAQADSEKAQAEARKAQAEAEKAKIQAKRIEAEATLAKSLAEAQKTSLLSIVDEDELGKAQRRQIQARLHQLGIYKGEVIGIFGPLTRAAIMQFQRNRGSPATGRLTGREIKALLVDPN